jgi:alpha-L-fucosidase 2
MLTEEGFENGLTFQHINYHWEQKDFYREGELYCHFQLDGSASVPGCIAEMLVQSHLDEIHLLPALPDEFKTGKITGVKARGGYTIDMEWKDGELVRANIYTKRNNPMPIVRLKGEIINLEDFNRIRIVSFN